MIISENTDAKLQSFMNLVELSKNELNKDAKARESYYRGRTAQKLESDVCDIMKNVAYGTEFDGSIILVSGHKFPDIVALVNENRNFGVEVKSTTQDHWESFGNSVLESSRYDNVERIFIMFGKLGGNIEFMARPYEDCLSAVTVTHYPRYHINMKLKPGHTIFDKINKSYDTVRSLNNPVAPFAEYYRSQLKEGESLWWLGDSANEEKSMKVRIWHTLGLKERNKMTVKALAWFPETISGPSHSKYDNYALWLVTSHGIVAPNIRDAFSAGGRLTIDINGHTYKKIPKVYKRIYEFRGDIYNEIVSANNETINRYWNENDLNNNQRMAYWISSVASYKPIIEGNDNTYSTTELLYDIFSFAF